MGYSEEEVKSMKIIDLKAGKEPMATYGLPGNRNVHII